MVEWVILGYVYPRRRVLRRKELCRPHPLDAPTGTAEMTRSNEQLKQTALRFLREALAMDYDDDQSIDYAARMMGKEYLPLIGQTHARMKPTEPI